MGFLFKFFKELNSAQSEKFITLAVVLGLICGFLPFFSFFTLLIFFIAFVIRIPFGLFLASLGVFSVVGYFLDPLFAKTGYVVLTSSFSPVWEFLYNLPLMRWSGYNNTVVAGSLLWGVVFSVVLYFVLNKGVSLYRKSFFEFCGRYKFLKWLVPGFTKSKIFRLSGIAGVVVIFGGIGVVLALFFDPVVKRTLEYSLSKVLHKPVKIEKLNTSFYNAKIDIKNLYIGDVKTDKVNVKLSWNYLVWKKFNIENLIIDNIHTEKSIRELIGAEGEKNTKADSGSFAPGGINISLPKPQQLIKGYQLESLQKIEKLRTDYEEFIVLANDVKKTIKNDSKKISKIKADIAGLEKMSKNIKSSDDIQKILSKTEEIKKQINSINNDIKNKKERLLSSKRRILKDFDEIKKATKYDYEKLSAKYDLLKEGKYYRFASTFLKPEIKKYTDKFIKYYQIIKPYLKEKAKKKNEYVRSGGIYIKYNDKIKYPDFVLNKAKISGKTKDMVIDAQINSISSNQTLLNKKGTMNVNAKSEYFESLRLYIEYFEKVKLKLDVKNAKIEKFDIKNMKFLHTKIDINLKGTINGEKIDIVSVFNIQPEKIDFTANKYIARVFKNLKKLNVKVFITGRVSKYNIKIDSDIDRYFSDYLKKELNVEIKKSKAKLNKILNQKVSEEIKNTGFDQRKLSVLNDISSFENSLAGIKESLGKYTKNALSKHLIKKGIRDFIKF